MVSRQEAQWDIAPGSPIADPAGWTHNAHREQTSRRRPLLLFDRFNLGHGFRKYFEIHAAIDDSLRDHVYRIRHEVYCEELGFEPVRPDRR